MIKQKLFKNSTPKNLTKDAGTGFKLRESSCTLDGESLLAESFLTGAFHGKALSSWSALAKAAFPTRKEIPREGTKNLHEIFPAIFSRGMLVPRHRQAATCIPASNTTLGNAYWDKGEKTPEDINFPVIILLGCVYWLFPRPD